MSERCEQLREHLSGYVDGALTPEEHEAVEEHLGSCAECRAELEALRRTVTAVASLPRRAAPSGLAGRVVAELRSEGAPAHPAIITVLWARALPIAAMLLIVFGITFMVGYPGAVRRSAARDKLAMSLPADEEAQEAEVSAEELAQVAHAPASAGEPAARPAPLYLYEEEMMDADLAKPDAYRAGAAGRAEGEEAAGGSVAATVAPPAAGRAQVRLRRPEDGKLQEDGAVGITEPGLHWNAVGDDRAAVAAEAAAEREAQTAFGAALTGQAGGRAGGWAVRTVAFSAEDPEAAALQIVNVANANGLLVSVGLLPLAQQKVEGGARGAELARRVMADAPAAQAPRDGVDVVALHLQETTVRLRVPVDRCDALIAELRGALAQRTPPAAAMGEAAAGDIAEAKETAVPEAPRAEAAAVAGPAAEVMRTATRQDELRKAGASVMAERSAMVELIVVIRPVAAAAVARSAPVEQPAQ
jgi:hypothetical protein